MANKIFVGIPVAEERNIDYGILLSLSDLTNDAKKYGFEFVVHCFTGMGWNVAASRNALVAHFLVSDCTHLFFIDSDINWGPDAVGRLVMAPVEIVGGSYRSKTGLTERIHYHADPIFEDGTWMTDAITGLLPTKFVPTGFMCIRREAIELLIKDSNDWYKDPFQPQLERIYNVFEFRVSTERRELHTEDKVFCDKWLSIGGKLWLDPEISLSHIGKCPYSGRLMDIMTRSN